MAHKCKIFETDKLTPYGHYTHVSTMTKVTDRNTENNIGFPNKNT